MGSLRGAGLVATVVVSAGLWLFAHGSGGSTPATPGYCQDVDRLSSVVADVGGAADGAAQAARLGPIASRLTRDGTALTKRQDPAAAAVTALAADVDQWQTAIIANDAVDETIALDRTLSAMGSVPGC